MLSVTLCLKVITLGTFHCSKLLWNFQRIFQDKRIEWVDYSKLLVKFLNLMRNFLFFKTASIVVFNEFERRISDCAILPSYFVVFFSLLFGPFHSKSFPLYIINLLFYFVCPLTFLKCLFFFFSLYMLKLLFFVPLHSYISVLRLSLYYKTSLFVSLYFKTFFFVP